MDQPSQAIRERAAEVVAASFQYADRANIAELAEQIAVALARELREPGAASAPEQGGERVLRVGALTVDLDQYEARLDGKPLKLKPQEFALLAVLARHPGQVFTRAKLLDLAWPADASLEVVDRAVDVHVCRLRRSLRASGTGIRTVTRVGYKLVSDT